MEDARIKKILHLVEELSASKLPENATAKVDVEGDDLDRILSGLTLLTENKATPAVVDEVARLEEIIEVISSYAKLKYSAKAHHKGEGGILDALAIGINMLGEELKATTISRSYLNNILKSMLGLVFVVDLRGEIQMVNNGVLKRLSVDEKTIVGQQISNFIESLPESLFGGEMISDEIHTSCRTVDGTEFPITFSASPLQNKPGEAPNIVCVAHDITERKETADKLRESEYMFRNLVETMNDGVMLVDVDQQILYVNQHFLEMTGYEEEEVMGRNARDLFISEKDIPFVDRTFAERMQGQSARYEMEIHSKKQEPLWMRLCASPVRNIDGEIIGSMIVHTDITYRKIAELELQNSLTEKEMLIKEVHHRVKNNLQVISSLLSLQTSSVENDVANAILRESQNRIKSMAIIHEKLYQSKNLSSIDFQEYTNEIINQLHISYGINTQEITISSDVKDIKLGVDIAVPCGLILNELVSNSIKYAFPNQKKGNIDIKLHRNGGDLFYLSVSDNGIGIPETVDFRDTQSLGLQLVTTLTEQLDGDIDLDRTSGTRFNIRFKDPV